MGFNITAINLFFSQRIIPAAPHLIPFYIKNTNFHKKVHYINGFVEKEDLKNMIEENSNANKMININLDNFICLSSSIIRHKGIIEFLEIYSEYKNKSKNDYLKLIVIGDGPLLSDCYKFCKEKI